MLFPPGSDFELLYRFVDIDVNLLIWLECCKCFSEIFVAVCPIGNPVRGLEGATLGFGICVLGLRHSFLKYLGCFVWHSKLKLAFFYRPKRIF